MRLTPEGQGACDQVGGAIDAALGERADTVPSELLRLVVLALRLIGAAGTGAELDIRWAARAWLSADEDALRPGRTDRTEPQSVPRPHLRESVGVLVEDDGDDGVAAGGRMVGEEDERLT